MRDLIGEGDCEDCGAPSLVFTESPPGTTSLTSVVLRTLGDNPGQFAAVHTQHTKMFGELSTVTFLGFCRQID